MKATIKTGSKQYNVELGSILEVEKLEGSAGDKVKFEPICVIDGAKIDADPNSAKKTVVVGEIVEQKKSKKVVVFKFKRRKNYKVKNGHRQQVTKIKIVQIGDKKFQKKVEKKNTKKDNKTPKVEAKKINKTTKETKNKKEVSKTKKDTKKIDKKVKKETK